MLALVGLGAVKKELVGVGVTDGVLAQEVVKIRGSPRAIRGVGGKLAEESVERNAKEVVIGDDEEPLDILGLLEIGQWFFEEQLVEFVGRLDIGHAIIEDFRLGGGSVLLTAFRKFIGTIADVILEARLAEGKNKDGVDTDKIFDEGRTGGQLGSNRRGAGEVGEGIF